MFRKNTFVAAVLGAFLIIGGVVVPLHASDQCEQRIRKAESNFNKAVRKHGERSRQAEQRRRDLDRARESCRVDEHSDHGHGQENR